MSFNFMAAVTVCSDFGVPKKLKSLTVSIVSPFICHEVMGLDAMILVLGQLGIGKSWRTKAAEVRSPNEK